MSPLSIGVLLLKVIVKGVWAIDYISLFPNELQRVTTVKDVLIHIITEELHHRGEIITILWQMNVPPPDMAWLSVMKKTDPVWIME
jgi:uncharacterized damage-inducible protein DinB